MRDTEREQTERDDKRQCERVVAHAITIMPAASCDLIPSDRRDRCV